MLLCELKILQTESLPHVTKRPRWKGEDATAVVIPACGASEALIGLLYEDPAADSSSRRHRKTPPPSAPATKAKLPCFCCRQNDREVPPQVMILWVLGLACTSS